MSRLAIVDATSDDECPGGRAVAEAEAAAEELVRVVTAEADVEDAVDECLVRLLVPLDVGVGVLLARLTPAVDVGVGTTAGTSGILTDGRANWVGGAIITTLARPQELYMINPPLTVETTVPSRATVVGGIRLPSLACDSCTSR